MRDLLLHPFVYRLWRLRRLLLFAHALPGAALLGLSLLTQGEALLVTGWPLLAVAIVSCVTLVGLVLKYPAAPGEVIVCAMTISVLVLMSPLAEMLAAGRDQPLGGSDVMGLVLITLFVAACVFLGAAVLVNWLSKLGARPQLRWTLTHRTDLPAEQAFDILKPAPDTAGSWYRYGPADKDGRFSAWITRPDLRPQVNGPASGQGDGPSYVVEVKDLAPLCCSIVSVLPDGRSEANILTVHPVGNGSRIELKALQNVFTWWEAFVLIYLADLMTDHTIATLDDSLGRTPVRAIWLLPFDSLTLWLERRYGQKDNGGPQF